ncbi:MAG: topoisomerase [Thermoplasmata archaeon]|nr:MAG: topoisomerase [Thermoplasmata archaeon]
MGRTAHSLAVLEAFEEWLSRAKEENLTTPILVEGRRDREALRSLGFEGEIVLLNQGHSILFVVREISRMHGRVIVLTDWDAKGNRLAALVVRACRANTIEADMTLRLELMNIVKKDASTVEALDTLYERLRRVAEGHR